MFDDVLVVYTAWDAAASFKQLVVPVCRKSGYDDVLPDPPEYLRHQQYSILRAPADGNDGDASNSFVGGLLHDGLVVLSSKQLPQTLVLPTPGGFPWHPVCEQFTRRGCRISTAVLQEATARQQRQQEKQQKEQQLGANQLQTQKSRQQSVSQPQRQQCGPVQLVPVALHMDEQFLQDVAAAVIQHNKAVQQEQLERDSAQQEQQQGPSLQDLIQRQQQLMRQITSQQRQQQHQQQVPRLPVMPLLLQTVEAAAAAAVIQSSWRAHKSRLVNNIAQRALCNRAAVAIQRAWRAFLLKQRLQLLSTVSAAWQAGQRLRYSSITCVDVASRRLVETAAERSRTGQGMFPEHRLRFIVDNEGSVALVDMADINSSSSSSHGRTAAAAESAANQDDQRVGHIPNSSGGGGGSNSRGSSGGSSSSKSSSAAVRVGLPKWLGVDIPTISATDAARLLEDQVWFEPFGRADAGKLVEIGCDAKDLLAPSLIANPGLVHPTDVAQLITFKSAQQAAARAALLAALTYSVKARASCRLLSVQDSPLGAAYRSLAGGDTSSTAGSTGGGTAGSTAGSTRIASGAESAASTPTARVAARAAAGGVKFMKGFKKGAKVASSSSGGGSAVAGNGTTAAAAGTVTDGDAPSAATSAATFALASASAASASFAAAVDGTSLTGHDAGSAAATGGSSTARIAARTAAAYEEQLAAEAAKAVESAMETLRVLEPDNPAPLHQLPLLPIMPTETLVAAAAETAVAPNSAIGTMQKTAAGVAAGAAAVPGSVTFETHKFHTLPHLQKLAAGMEVMQVAAAAAAAAAAGANHVEPTQAAATTAAGAVAKVSAGAVVHSQATEAVTELAAQPPTAVPLAVNLAEYITKVKQDQVEAFKLKLAADAAAAAATSDAELAAKHRAVQAMRAAEADETGSTAQEPRSTSCANCPAPGYWPNSTAATAELVQLQKQQQQQAAAAAAAALREKELLAREELLGQQAATKATAQVEAQIQAQALQQKLLQQEEQQQQAASSRVALLLEIRKSGKVVAARRQEVAAALNRQCNMFSKHLKRGEDAVVRAAHSKAAAGHAAELRQTNSHAAALAQQKRQDMDSACAAKAAQERQEAKLAVQAAKDIADMELAALRASVAAQRLDEKQMAQSVGPAGGVWGSTKPDGVLKLPLKIAVVGTVDSRSTTRTPGV